MPSASEVDSGKIASRVVACRHDPKRQHGHLLPQVSLAIFTQSVDEQAYLHIIYCGKLLGNSFELARL